MENQDNSKNKANKTLVIVTYVFTSLLALFFLMAFGPKLVDEYIGIIRGTEQNYFEGWEGIVMELTFFAFMIGYIVSIKRRCMGGIIILLSSIIQMGPFLIIDGNMGSLIFGIPLLISGILFLIICKQSL
jgi:hypothetical protein